MSALPEHRGKGLMRLLLEAVRSAAREESALEMRLYVHGANRRAIKVYSKANFASSACLLMTMSVELQPHTFSSSTH